MAEINAKHQLVDSLRLAGAHVELIENSIGIGIPDLYYCLGGVQGWIECKNLMDWPVRASTSVRLKHPFSREQRVWFRRNISAGGKPMLYIRIENSNQYILLRGSDAVWRFDVENGLTQAEVYQFALYNGAGEFGNCSADLRAAIIRQY